MSKFIISGFSDEIDARLSVQMDELDKLDIHYIEVRGVDDKNIAQHSHEEVRAIKKRLKARGFKISAVGSPHRQNQDRGRLRATSDRLPACAGNGQNPGDAVHPHVQFLPAGQRGPRKVP